MERFAAGERSGWFHPVGQGGAERPLVWLLTGEMQPDGLERMESVLLPEMEAGRIPPCVLAGFEPVDWFAEYAPWPLTTPDGRQMGSENGLNALLDFAQKVFVPEAEKRSQSSGGRYAVGYSLGGLAALYAAGRVNGFDGAGSCSGSLWYPGFAEHVAQHRPQCPVYLSLGDRERRTSDVLMAQVEERTRQVYAMLQTHTPATFVLEKGGHFHAVHQRIARAVLWLLQSRKR